ncbi:FAD-dependent monooxygenase [Saccharothrix syringae]|uniref:FAD-dependent oxidoreductase n=1 Tax=Saccharothrix syringae TaxID=103733 RepID=A0A5Q0GYX8_SACSY|nr:FAD-dependent monooxygenase [Saccharothrix syringae]QFZ18720.1 FAD-dependent oxidoreductase [Saccharothrix syringae]
MTASAVETADVVIVGAGPVGLMLAGELCLAGVRPVVVERSPRRVPVPQAGGLVGQVVRLMDHRGLYEGLSGDAAPPRPVDVFPYGAMPLLLGGWADNPLYAFTIQQWELEAHLEAWAVGLGAELRRGQELLGFEQDADGVTARLTGGSLRARYLVGCDGGHSRVRKLAGIGFPGVSARRMVVRAADAVLPESERRALTDEPASPGGLTYRRTDHGVFASVSIEAGVHRVTAVEWDRPEVADGEPVTFDEVRAAVARVLGRDVPMGEPGGPGPHVLRRLPGFNTRLADRYRVGRVLIAGDAAHVHSSIGGPGLNAGLQDAVNLGWKLAAEVRGWAPAGLLDTYQEERRPAGERVVVSSQAQLALLAPGSEVTALREVFGELLADPANARRIAAMMAGADVRHPSAGDDELTGRWVPDFPLTRAGRPVRPAELARTGRPLLVDLTGAPERAGVAAGWADRVDLVVATSDAAPADALLVRPDGYVAWAGADAASLADALRTWFGEPR